MIVILEKETNSTEPASLWVGRLIKTEERKFTIRSEALPSIGFIVLSCCKDK